MTANFEEIIKLLRTLCERTPVNEEYHKALQKLESQIKEKYEEFQQEQDYFDNALEEICEKFLLGMNPS
jgi:CHASE3 domain sensor protein